MFSFIMYTNFVSNIHKSNIAVLQLWLLHMVFNLSDLCLPGLRQFLGGSTHRVGFPFSPDDSMIR